jgi:putative FmdB family regulatory protein
MPIYAFECDSCGHQFERLQRLADADPSQCPECQAEQVRRQLTAPSFRLAGAGWYETDFKKDGDKKRNLAEKGESSSSTGSVAASSKGESKPEAKPAAKSEPKPEPKPAPKATS